MQAGGRIIDSIRSRTTYIPAAEVRNMLCVSRAALCAWVNRGDIKGVVRPGNRNVFDPACLAEFIESRMVIL